MLEQIGNPLGVFDIRFPPRNSLDMLRIAKQQFHPFPLQHVPDTLPIDTSPFHRHGLATLNFEPVAEPEEIRDHGCAGYFRHLLTKWDVFGYLSLSSLLADEPAGE